EALAKDFEKAAAWAKKHERPVYLGEFGSYHVADMESRARWTRAGAREAEKDGLSWGHWGVRARLGADEPAAQAWREAAPEGRVGWRGGGGAGGGGRRGRGEEEERRGGGPAPRRSPRLQAPAGSRSAPFLLKESGMHLTPREIEKVLVYSLAEIALKRKAKGL